MERLRDLSQYSDPELVRTALSFLVPPADRWPAVAESFGNLLDALGVERQTMAQAGTTSLSLGGTTCDLKDLLDALTLLAQRVDSLRPGG